jgi:hypothetical protein
MYKVYEIIQDFVMEEGRDQSHRKNINSVYCHRYIFIVKLRPARLHSGALHQIKFEADGAQTWPKLRYKMQSYDQFVYIQI